MPLLNFQPTFALPVLAGLEQRRREERYAGREPTPIAWREEAEQIAATFAHPKRQTIRAYRKAGNPKPGDTLYLYTGARTKACRKLGEAVCLEAIPMHITHKGFGFEGGHHLGHFIKLYGHGASLMKGFASADGFSDWPAMRDWFEKTHGLPFNGLLIRW